MRFAAAILPAVAVIGCATANTSYLAKVNDDLVTGPQLVQEFGRRHRGLEKSLIDPAEVRKVVVRVVDHRLMIEEGYRMGLQDAPELRTKVEQARRDRATARLLEEEISNRTTPSDEEVRAAYALTSTRLVVRQVVVRTREEAEAIAAQLRGGVDLDQLARTRSLARSAKLGGLDRFEWGASAPGETRERLLWSLKEGELGPVYETPEGWEIDRIERRLVEPDDERFTFEELEDRIRTVLRKRKTEVLREAFFAGLWTKYEARILECAPTLAALKAAKEKGDETACASWKGGTLTLGTFAKRVRIDQLEAAGEPNYPEFRKILLEDSVNRELAAAEAVARGYGQRPEVAADARSVEEGLVEAKLYSDYVMKDVEPDDAALKAYFDAHRADYVKEEQLAVAQIVVDTPEKAKEVQDKLATEPFEKLAEAYSDDPRGARGGYVGEAPKSEFKGEMAPIAALAPGQVSAPIQTGRGYHLVKVLRTVPSRPLELDEVKDQVREKLREQRRAAAIARWMKPLKESARIKINDPGIRAFVDVQRAALEKEMATNEAKAQRIAASVKAREAAKEKRQEKEAAEAKAKEAAGTAQPADAAAPASPAAAPADGGAAKPTPVPAAAPSAAKGKASATPRAAAKKRAPAPKAAAPTPAATP